MRYFAVISYDGTHFLGWQKQHDGDQSVQFCIENALTLLCKEKIEVVGCGRTDTGVHAKNYHLHFDVEVTMEIDQLIFRLNRILPNSIAVHDIYQVRDDVHARFHAIERSYVYRLKNVSNPFENHYCFHYPYADELHLDKLNEAARLLLSYNDFNTFCKTRTDVKTTLCKISRSEWTYDEENKIYEYHITADRFLRGMIRLIVGMCLNVNRGNLSLEEVRHALDTKTRLQKDWSVDAKGLILYGIKYKK